jgi:conjugative transposon TraK protein
MNLKTLKNIPESFQLAKYALIVCFTTSIFISIGSLVWAFSLTNKFQEKAIVISEQGAAVMGKTINANELLKDREKEINSHIKNFHRLYWTVDQYNYNDKINKSLYLIGQTGKDLYLYMKSKGDFSKLVSQNLKQKLKVDSIIVNDAVYPYTAALYGTLEINRSDQISGTKQPFNSNMILQNVMRTYENPHGLIIENYAAKTSLKIK